eukprot:13285769-Alexandrium_andersonii.AAC.1
MALTGFQRPLSANCCPQLVRVGASSFGQTAEAKVRMHSCGPKTARRHARMRALSWPSCGVPMRATRRDLQGRP